MPRRKRSSDYCNADAKRKKERIAAETSNERRARLSEVRLRRRNPSTLYRAAFSYDCNYDYVIIISVTSLHCSHLAALSFLAALSASGARACAASICIYLCCQVITLPGLTGSTGIVQ